jgi:septum site-determining protein MinD
LADLGIQVLCIDCDVGLRNLDISLGLTDCGSLSFLDICSGNYSFDQIPAHPQYPGLYFLTAPVNATADEVDAAAFAAMLQQAREKFHYIFLDAPAGIDAGFRLAAQYADRIILVTGADPAAVRDAARAGQLLDHMGKQNARIVVNRVAKKMVATMSVTVDDVMDDTGLPLLGVVPEDPNVTLAAAFGKPLLKYRPRSAAAKACKRIANRIQGIPDPINLR